MELAVPILPADDLGKAKTFYVDGLGFRVTFEVSRDGRHGLLGLERGTIQLTIDSPMDGHGRMLVFRSTSKMPMPVIESGVPK
jgi:hypothetical protein